MDVASARDWYRRDAHWICPLFPTSAIFDDPISSQSTLWNGTFILAKHWHSIEWMVVDPILGNHSMDLTDALPFRMQAKS